MSFRGSFLEMATDVEWEAAVTVLERAVEWFNARNLQESGDALQALDAAVAEYLRARRRHASQERLPKPLRKGRK